MEEIDKIIQKVSPYYAKKAKRNKGKLKPEIKYNLIYDSPAETLEPIYFWFLNFMHLRGWKVEKLVDNFASSPGSGHFSELGLKKSQMQDQASKVMATINSILRSVLNLIYDLKEFKIRLSHYDAANSKDKNESEVGILALKQIWMDKVDIQRGQGSINAMSSGNLQFVTLRDAFLTARSPKDVDNIDLNERVKRILKPRVQEFFEWAKRSEQELRKRFEIEKTYLKSQVESLKLQSRWAKPYLKAAEKLAQNEELADDAALVTAFNTVLLQLSLMVTSPINVEGETIYSRHGGRTLPEEFAKMSKKLRTYYSVVIIDFRFTGIPSKSGQHYVFGGKADLEFKSYSLNQDEMDLLKEELGNSDLYSALKLVQGMTDDSLQELKFDLDEFMGDKEKKEEDVNPFLALFGFSKKEKKSEEDKKKEKLEILKNKGVKKDSYRESYIRNLAIAQGMDNAFFVYDIYKKNHGMAAFPYAATGMGGPRRKPPQSAVDRLFGFK